MSGCCPALTHCRHVQSFRHGYELLSQTGGQVTYAKFSRSMQIVLFAFLTCLLSACVVLAKYWSQPLVARLLYDAPIPGLVASTFRGPEEDSLFTRSAIVDEPIDTVFNETLAGMIRDYNEWDACALDRYEGLLNRNRKILEVWKAVADHEEIPYLIFFGTLLGYMRNKTITPYDQDMDVVLPSWAYDKLRKYSLALPITEDVRRKEKVLFFLHPEYNFVNPKQRRRYSCTGEVIDYYDGQCSFTAPMGRLIYRAAHLDLFTVDHLPQYKTAILVEDRIEHLDVDTHFPPRPCTFLGFELLCPNNPLESLSYFYSPKRDIADLRPTMLCINGEWMHQKDAPDVFEKKLARWRRDNAMEEDLTAQAIHRKYIPVVQWCGDLDPPIDTMKYGYCNPDEPATP